MVKFCTGHEGSMFGAFNSGERNDVELEVPGNAVSFTMVQMNTGHQSALSVVFKSGQNNKILIQNNTEPYLRFAKKH